MPRAGVNRLSLGVQALDEAALRFLGRRPRPRRGDRGDPSRPRIFPRYSFDLIYARPGQTLAAWDEELEEALGLAGEHLSLYQLTIEAGTAFGNRAARGEILSAEEEMPRRCSRQRRSGSPPPACRPTKSRNHARPGAECRHNLAYWRYQDYVGIGPGAHGRITREGGKMATRQRRAPEDWLAAIDSIGTGIDELTPISRDAAIEEIVMMGLRLVEGVPRRRLETLAERDVGELFGDELSRLVEGGFLTLDADRLVATEAGRQRLNAVLAALLA